MNNQISIHQELTKVALLRRPDVERITGLSRSSIYAKMKTGEFPQSIPLTGRIVAWLQSEILEWVQSKIEIRKTNMGHTRPQSQPHRIRDAPLPESADVQPWDDRSNVSAEIPKGNFRNSEFSNVAPHNVASSTPPEQAVHPTNAAFFPLPDPAQL